MGILEYFLICLVVGVAIYLIHRFAPIPAQIKTLVLWAGIIVLVLLLLHALGIFGADVKIPKVR